MTGYIAHFLERPGQAAVLTGVAVLWVALAAIGSMAAGRQRPAGLDAVGGWAVVAALFTLGGVFTPLSFSAMAVALGVVAILALFLRWRREGRLADPGALRILVLALPLILLASAMQASQWDEFSHWLPSTQFLLDADAFPDADRPRTGASFPAYPYAWPLLSYLVAKLTGAFQESSGPLLNILLLLAFALTMTDVIRRGAAAGGSGAAATASAPSWTLCALATLAAIPFNPTFVQKVALTYYADTASAVTLGLACVLGWLALNAAAEGQSGLAARRAWQAGLALTVLVLLKQATFVLFLLLVGAVALAGLRDRAVGPRQVIRLLPGMTLLPLLVYAAWRYHVTTQMGAGAEFTIRPFTAWSFALIPDILLAMAVVLAKKGLYLGLMLIAIAFGMRALWRCESAFDRLALIAGCLFAGYNGFLFFSYVAAFGANDALRAGSLWRYNMHLGAVMVAFTWFGLALLWTRHNAAQRLGKAMRWLPAVPIVLIVVAPFAFAGKLRFDREPDKPFYRTVARDLAQTIPEGRRFGILDPQGSGESWVITLFQLGQRVTATGYLAAFHDTSVDNIRLFLESQRPDALLVHSVSPAVREVLEPALSGGAALAPGPQSYLLLRDGEAAWHIARTWTRPPS